MHACIKARQQNDRPVTKMPENIPQFHQNCGEKKAFPELLSLCFHHIGFSVHRIICREGDLESSKKCKKLNKIEKSCIFSVRLLNFWIRDASLYQFTYFTQCVRWIVKVKAPHKINQLQTNTMAKCKIYALFWICDCCLSTIQILVRALVVEPMPNMHLYMDAMSLILSRAFQHESNSFGWKEEENFCIVNGIKTSNLRRRGALLLK